jgi:hypothetical protein
MTARTITLTVERIGPAYWEVAEVEAGEFIRAKYQIPVGHLETWLETIEETPEEEKWITPAEIAEYGAALGEMEGC